MSEATIWGMFRTSRTTCVRTVRAGGRYNLIDSSATVVKNSQFVSSHVRGHWCASRIRVAMELAADLHNQGHKVAWWAIDNMARIPLIVDATSQVYARNRGHTMRGDGRKFYDHHIAVGTKMLMEVTGIVMCQGTDGVPLKDQFDRQRLPRPRAIHMEVFIRGVPDLPSGCTQRLHWDNIESAYLSLAEDDRPEFLFISVDNGSGFDPTDEALVLRLQIHGELWAACLCVDELCQRPECIEQHCRAALGPV